MFTLAASLYAVALAGYLLLRVAFGDAFWWLSLLNSFAHVLFMPLVALLPLSGLLRSRAALRLFPLGLIGGLWFLPYFLPRSALLGGGATLHVATFNVWGYRPEWETLAGWIEVNGADILLLQEISPDYARDALPRLRDRYPYQVSQADDPRFGGNVILSRYPILDSRIVDVQTPDTLYPQRFLVDVNGQTIAVYNAHLAWPVGNPRLALARSNFYLNVALGYNDSARNNQIEHLLRALESEPYPYIVAGDFNLSASSATYNQLAALMNDAYRTAGEGMGLTWPVSGARGLPGLLPPLLRIDYIWHSADFRAARAWLGQPGGSDHVPVHALLKMVTGGR